MQAALLGPEFPDDDIDEYEDEDEYLEPSPPPPSQISPHSPSAPAEADGPTVLELVRSDRFGRLRAELAEAVAAAEIEKVHEISSPAGATPVEHQVADRLGQ